MPHTTNTHRTQTATLDQQTPARNGGELHTGPSARYGEVPPTRHQQHTPARSGVQLQPGPSGRMGQVPPTTTSGRPQLGMAGKCTQGPQPELARDHPPTPARSSSPPTHHTYTQPLTHQGHTRHTHTNTSTKATTQGTTNTPTFMPHTTSTHRAQQPIPYQQKHPPPPAAEPSQEWQGTAPRALSQDWRGTDHHHQQGTPARNGGEPHLGPSARTGEGLPNNNSSGHQPQMADNCTQDPQPGLARDHPPT